jgi:hypothetical protein
MLWAAIAYSAGIVAGVYLWRPSLWWVIGGSFFVFAAIYFSRRRSTFAWVLALAAFFLAGALHIQLSNASTYRDTSIQPYADAQALEITAHVTRDGRLQPGSFGEIRQSLDVETEEIKTETGQIIPIRSGIRLSIYSPRSTESAEEDSTTTDSRPMPTFHYADRLRFSAKLRLPRNFRNP